MTLATFFIIRASSLITLSRSCSAIMEIKSKVITKNISTFIIREKFNIDFQSRHTSCSYASYPYNDVSQYVSCTLC